MFSSLKATGPFLKAEKSLPANTGIYEITISLQNILTTDSRFKQRIMYRYQSGECHRLWTFSAHCLLSYSFKQLLSPFSSWMMRFFIFLDVKQMGYWLSAANLWPQKSWVPKPWRKLKRLNSPVTSSKIILNSKVPPELSDRIRYWFAWFNYFIFVWKGLFNE